MDKIRLRISDSPYSVRDYKLSILLEPPTFLYICLMENYFMAMCVVLMRLKSPPQQLSSDIKVMDTIKFRIGDLPYSVRGYYYHFC